MLPLSPPTRRSYADTAQGRRGVAKRCPEADNSLHPASRTPTDPWSGPSILMGPPQSGSCGRTSESTLAQGTACPARQPHADSFYSIGVGPASRLHLPDSALRRESARRSITCHAPLRPGLRSASTSDALTAAAVPTVVPGLHPAGAADDIRPIPLVFPNCHPAPDTTERAHHHTAAHGERRNTNDTVSEWVAGHYGFRSIITVTRVHPDCGKAAVAAL